MTILKFVPPTTAKTWAGLSVDANKQAEAFQELGQRAAAIQARDDAATFAKLALDAECREVRLAAQQEWRRGVEPAIARGCQAVLDIAARKS